MPEKLQRRIEEAIFELENLASKETNSDDARAYRKVATNLKRGEWAAAYRNTWRMDTYPRDGISYQTYSLICILGG